MSLKTLYYLLSIMTTICQGLDFTPSSDQYLFAQLSKLINSVDLFDGPASISQFPSTRTKSRQPTLEQMKYYNYYAASSYCSYELYDLSCKYCRKFRQDINHHKVIRNTTLDTLAMISVSDSREEIIVTYRGSHNLYNFILDVELFSIKYPDEDDGGDDIRIHVGVYKATMSLYFQIVTELWSALLDNPNYKIVLVGHSLGGCMATITAFFLNYKNQFPGMEYALYSYGSSRVGNKGFVDFMNGLNITMARITARADIIPHIIPVSIASTKLIIGDYYLHHQSEYWINGATGGKFCNNNIYEDPTCSNSMGPLYSFFIDHLMYFDVLYLTCMASQPSAFLSLPYSIFEPTLVLPPLPKFISGPLGKGVDYFFNKILGPLG